MPALIQALDRAIFRPKDGQATPRTAEHICVIAGQHCRSTSPSTWALVKKVVNFTRRFRAHAGNFGEVGLGGALDCLECAKVLQERALAGRPDARDLLQAGLAQVLFAPGAMRADRKTMRLVAQPLDAIEDRVARLEHERIAAGDVEGLPAGVTVGPFGHTHEWYVGEAKCRQRLGCSTELATATVDDHEIRPGRVALFIAFNVVRV